jgi:hypothetical protein
MSDAAKPPRADAELLGSLLGPGAPELTCEECFEQLDRYAELAVAGEPADQRVPGMRAHLDGCPACAEDFASLRDLLAAEAERRR